MKLLDDGSEVDLHLHEMVSIHSKLAIAGFVMSDDEFIPAILHSLPESWDMYVTQLIDTPRDQLKYKTICERLIQYQQCKREHEGEHTGSFMGRQSQQHRWKPFNKNKNKNKNKNRWCDYHQTASHTNSECHHQRNNNNNKSGQQQQQQQSQQQSSSSFGAHSHVSYSSVPDTMGCAYMFCGAFTLLKKFADIWLMDSGATHHNCTRLNWFTKINFHDPTPFSCGSFNSTSYGMGVIRLLIKLSDGSTKYSHLHNVLWVLKYSINLFLEMVVQWNGFSRLGEGDYLYIYPPSCFGIFNNKADLFQLQCQVIVPQPHKQKITGSNKYKEQKHYNTQYKNNNNNNRGNNNKQNKFNKPAIPQANNFHHAHVKVDNTPLQVWHNRLGHCGVDHLCDYGHVSGDISKKLLKQQLPELCPGCAAGHIKRTAIEKGPLSVPQHKGDLVYIDANGMSEPSLGGVGDICLLWMQPHATTLSVFGKTRIKWPNSSAITAFSSTINMATILSMCALTMLPNNLGINSLPSWPNLVLFESLLPLTLLSPMLLKSTGMVLLTLWLLL